MKAAFFTLLILFLMLPQAFAQSSSYEGVMYRTPLGFKHHPNKNALILVNKKGEKQTVITLYKPGIGSDSADKNFEDFWGRLERIDVKTETPTKTGPKFENGWSVIAGLSSGEYGGKPVAVMVVSATAGERVINLLIISDIDEHSEQITEFINNIVLPQTETIGNKQVVPKTPRMPNIPSSGSDELNGLYQGCFTWGYNFGSTMLVTKPGNIPQFTINNGRYTAYNVQGGSVRFENGIITFSGGAFDRWRAVVEILKDGSFTILFRSNRLQPRPAGQPHQVGDHQCFRKRE